MIHPLQAYYSRIYKTYDLVNTIFTFGLDKKWRRIAADQCLSSNPERILDLCCGTGDLAIMLSKKASEHTRVTGLDLNAEMLQIAKSKTTDDHNGPDFIRGDASSLPFDESEFDCITIGFGFRNLTWENPNRDRHISEIARVLKQGGKLFILESSKPENPLIHFFYTLYLKLVLVPIGGLLSGNWEAYRYLAGSSAGFYTFNEMKQLLKNFGLDLQYGKRFLAGSANLLIGVKTRT